VRILQDVAPRRQTTAPVSAQSCPAQTGRDMVNLQAFAREPPPLTSSLVNENARPIDPFFPVDLDSPLGSSETSFTSTACLEIRN
jgi:hypothetical protein